MSLPLNSFISTPALYVSYLEACDKQKRESATVPFWENVLNRHMADEITTVNSQQPTDDTNKAVDLTVNYIDTKLRSIILLMMECKRNKRKTPSALNALEDQLDDYVLYFFDLKDGRAERDLVFGAVAAGPLIRIFQYARGKDGYVSVYPIWGGEHETGEKFYKDAMKDGDEILRVLTFIKNSRTDPYPAGNPPFPLGALLGPTGTSVTAGGTSRNTSGKGKLPVKVQTSASNTASRVARTTVLTSAEGKQSLGYVPNQSKSQQIQLTQPPNQQNQATGQWVNGKRYTGTDGRRGIQYKLGTEVKLTSESDWKLVSVRDKNIFWHPELNLWLNETK